MRLVVTVVCWIAVFAGGVWLRFDDLGERPFHSDEATGARITAHRMESEDYRFDPTHFHGPLLSSLAMPFCQASGQARWSLMEKRTLRLLPALAGALLVLAPLLGRRRWGDGPMLLAAAFLASSPLLVYYSRMFIHESLLGLFGVLLVFAVFVKPRHGLPGILLGLMFATKETVAISIIAWGVAAALLAIENRRRIDRAKIVAAWKDWRGPLLISVVTALFISLVFYTDWFRHLRGAVDSVRTFFVYKTTEGHLKPFGYYSELLLRPRQLAGARWFEGMVLVFAVLAYLSSFGRSAVDGKWRPAVRFLAYSAAGHFLIYSLISYKTPWLVLLPWAHVCVLAGFGVAGWSRWKWPPRIAVVVIAGLSLGWQTMQSRQATGRLAADDRNPYAYVPTTPDIETLVPWLREVGEAAPGIPLEPVAVIGTEIWPLPWYLRSFEQIGYWQEPQKIVAELDRFPLVFAVTESADYLMMELAETHIPVPRGLRFEVPVTVFIRYDVWDCWMEE